MYDELVKRLRDDEAWKNCDFDFIYGWMHDAADAIEELLDFAHFVAKEVVVSDDEWDNRQNAFPEIASRKLNKLGIVEKGGASWSYEPPKEAE